MTILVGRGEAMASWGATEAKAKFSAMLDQAEAEGPQLVRRRKREFYVLTREQMEERNKPTVGTAKPFVNAWEALRPPKELLSDEKFARVPWKLREPDL